MFELTGIKYKNILDIPELWIGEGLTALVGPSGSGKTTVLRMLSKMISPDEGSIRYRGTDLSRLESVKHRRSVMMLSQTPAMFEGTIRDNLAIALRFQEKNPPGEQALRQILDRVHLPKELDTPVLQLSGGEKQRLALGRVFLCDPEVYLLDEPSSALDDATEDVIIGMVADSIRAGKKSAVMVTHSIAVAEKYANEIIEMAGGKIRDRRSAHERNH